MSEIKIDDCENITGPEISYEYFVELANQLYDEIQKQEFQNLHPIMQADHWKRRCQAIDFIRQHDKMHGTKTELKGDFKI